MNATLNLNPESVRVLGCLIEKEMTTPEYYPLSLNALINACNQKSNRDPVMTLDEDAVCLALRNLTERGSPAMRPPKDACLSTNMTSTTPCNSAGAKSPSSVSC